MDGTYPVDLTDNLAELLRRAQHNEYEEHDDVYRHFGDKAREEGFERVARSFHMIAEIEKFHGDRFGRFAQWLEENQLHVSKVSCGWICLNCGYVFEGEQAPQTCRSASMTGDILSVWSCLLLRTDRPQASENGFGQWRDGKCFQKFAK